jgi:hypothetical protein
MPKLTTDDPDEFAILSAMWILSCNDEIPIMTYESIRYRLGLNKEFQLKEMVRKHGELFRRGVPSDRLARWKSDMLINRHSPGWLKEIDNREERNEAINSLTIDDVFRNQFRVEDKAPKVSMEVIDWGLQHIDRLRKAKLEAREQFAKQRDVYIAIAFSFLNLVIAGINIYITLTKPGG